MSRACKVCTGSGPGFSDASSATPKGKPWAQASSKAAAAALLDACAQGLPLGVALDASLNPGPDPVQTLHALLKLGVFARPTFSSPLALEHPA